MPMILFGDAKLGPEHVEAGPEAALDDLVARFPTALGRHVCELAVLPPRWLPIIDQAITRVASLLTPDELDQFTILDLRRRGGRLHLDARVAGLDEGRSRVLFHAIESIFQQAEDACDAMG
jgi:hypothetical protein